MNKNKQFRNLNLNIRRATYQKIMEDPANHNAIPIVIELHPLSQIHIN
jgi:hypothetical protein